MRVAVCFSGQLRTFDENWPSLHGMFLDAVGHEPDYFAALHESDHGFTSDLWTSCHIMRMQRAPDFDTVPIVYPTITAGLGPSAAWEQWQGLLSLRAQVRLVEEIRGVRYDWVVRCRPDLSVRVPMERLATLVPDGLYFPRHNNWGGLNDRFAFGPSVLMERYLAFPALAARFFLAGAERKKRNPEGLLAWHLANENILINRTAAVLMPNRGFGRIDQPTYRADRGDIVPA